MIPALIAVAMVCGSLFLQVTANVSVPLILSNTNSVISNVQSDEANLASPGTQSTSKTSSALQNAQANPPSSLNSTEQLTTITGRTKLWSLLLEMIKKRPWLGYGYGAFWLGNDGPSAEVWRVITWWKPPHAHNGWLDLWLELGLLGLISFLIGFLFNIIRALNLMRLHQKSETIWPLLYLVFIVLFNLTTSTLMVQNEIFWVLYVAVSFSLMYPNVERKTKFLNS